ncbi:MAG: hypothetical protein QGG90_11445, partial [Nitrospinota bacterium]|nr:hypothetical protein [Nitrospinota bacterium]
PPARGAEKAGKMPALPVLKTPGLHLSVGRAFGSVDPLPGRRGIIRVTRCKTIYETLHWIGLIELNWGVHFL